MLSLFNHMYVIVLPYCSGSIYKTTLDFILLALLKSGNYVNEKVTAEIRWCPSEPADGGQRVWVVRRSGQHSLVQQKGGSPDIWSGCLGPEKQTGPAHWRCAPVQFSYLLHLPPLHATLAEGRQQAGACQRRGGDQHGHVFLQNQRVAALDAVGSRWSRKTSLEGGQRLPNTLVSTGFLGALRGADIRTWGAWGTARRGGRAEGLEEESRASLTPLISRGSLLGCSGSSLDLSPAPVKCVCVGGGGGGVVFGGGFGGGLGGGGGWE